MSPKAVKKIKYGNKAVAMYDPYYIVDPTTPTLPRLGRTAGGRFNGYSYIPETPEGFPVDSALTWAAYARWSARYLMEITPENIENPYDEIYGGLHNNFSWRMIEEMLTAAIKWIEKDPANRAGDVLGFRSAAYDYLAEKQYDTARTQLERMIGECSEFSAIDASETLSNWLANNWNGSPNIETKFKKFLGRKK